MGNTDFDLLTRMEEEYKSFSKGQKAIASYIRENYDKAAFMTAGALGRKVGVSESTVVRFAYALGYKGYPKLQKHLQEIIKNKLTTVQRLNFMEGLPADQIIDTVSRMSCITWCMREKSMLLVFAAARLWLSFWHTI